MSEVTTRRPRILVLGGTGMLGHKLIQHLATQGFPVATTIRGASIPSTAAARVAFAGVQDLLPGVDVLSCGALEQAFEASRPDVVVNAVGIIKQLDAAKEAIPSIKTNALLPHRVAAVCAKRGARFIHLSTDCVFSGRKGPYSETDPPDAEDLYGRSKLLGEVDQPGCLTLRSSIIGRELRGRSGLIEWFLSQRGCRVAGYAGALYSGLTTSIMANLIARVATEFQQLSGIWHVASVPITKYDLLSMVNREFDLRIELLRDERFVADRRLNSERFHQVTGFSAPSWETMIAELRSDPTPYDEAPHRAL